MNSNDPDLLHLDDDGTFPNSRLPVLRYRTDLDEAGIAAAFTGNGWEGLWRDGIFSFHHYHSTAHEALGIARGTVRVQLGGPTGPVLDLGPGDVVILPAGTAHFNAGASPDLLVLGAYPSGQRPDILRGDPGERPAADERIAAVRLPESDPLHGPDGLLVRRWQAPRTG